MEEENPDWLYIDFDEAVQYTDEILCEPGDYPSYMTAPDDWAYGQMLTSAPTVNSSINTKTSNHNPGMQPKPSLTKQNKKSVSQISLDKKNVNRSTVHKVSWSVKNRTKGKTYKEYIGRQLKIGRRICGHIVNLFNNQDADLFEDFLDKYYAPNCIYREITKGPHPQTGEMDVDRTVEGLDVMKHMLKLSFKNIPDAVTVVDSLELLNEGKTIHICVTSIGTPMAAVPVDEWSKSDTSTCTSTGSDVMVRKTHVATGYTDVHLGNNNQIIKVVRFQQVEQEEV